MTDENLSPIAFYYTGDGYKFLPGIPARDLTEDDFMNLSDKDQARVLNSDCYSAE